MTTNTLDPSPTRLRRSGDISVLDAISILSEHNDAMLIDVRGEGDFVARLFDAVPDRSRLVLVIDEDGSTSQDAADAAAAVGYRRVLNIADGYRGLGDACPSLIPAGFQLSEPARP